MKRHHLASIADGIFVLAALVFVPIATDTLTNAAWSMPSLYFYMGVATMVFYPLTCIVILQKIATEKVLQEGLVSLKAFFKRKLGIPFLWAFVLILFFHSTIMGVSMLHGDLVSGFQNAKIADDSGHTLKTAMAITAFAIQVILTLYVVIKLAGFDLRAFFNQWRSDPNEPLSKGWRIFWIIFMIVMMPVYISLAAGILIIAIFCLYCIVWYYAFDRAEKRDFKKFFPESPLSRAVSYGILIIYTIILAFFFDSFIEHSITYQVGRKIYYATTMEAVFQTAFGMVLYYIPYRTFFGLYSGKSRLGWITFALSILIVFWQTLAKFHGT